MKLWITFELGWQNGSFAVVVREIARALAGSGHLVVSYGREDPNRPERPQEYVQLHFGLWDYEPWDTVKAYFPYPLYSDLPFPANSRGGIVEALNRASIVFCLDENTRWWFEAEGVTAPVRVVRHGANTDAYPFVERERAPGDPFTFVASGICRRQGGWLIPQAFQAAFEGGENVRLLLHDYGTVEQLAGEFTDDPRIEKIRPGHDGWLPEGCMGLFEQADCVVSPSMLESGDISLMEAMATGLPAIVSCCHNYREWVPRDLAYWVRNSTGLIPYREFYGGALDIGGAAIVPCRFSLSERMREVYLHPEEARARGAAGAAFIREHMTWGHAARQLLDLIAE